MAKYRVGVIGHTGRGNYGHGLDTVWLSIPDAEIVAVADANADGLRAEGERLGVDASDLYADYREMLAENELDFVSVCPRWIAEHRDMVIASADAGVKGIYCEKSFARTLREADEMLAACDAAGAKIAVAHQNRAHPFIIEAQQVIADGLIGEVREIHGFGKQDHRGGGQDMVVLGTHIFDLMRLFCGDPAFVDAMVLTNGRFAESGAAFEGDEEVGLIAGDHIRATLRFENGVVGTFRSRREGSHFGDRSMGFQIQGREGILDFRGDCLMHYPHGCWTPAPSDEQWRVVGDRARSKGVVALNEPLVLDLIDAVANDREPMCSGFNARWSLEMILGVYAAHRFGRTSLPMENRDHPLDGWQRASG